MSLFDAPAARDQTHRMAAKAAVFATLSLTLAFSACLTIVPDRFYVVEADDAVPLAARAGAVLLDVRPPADYVLEHAAGAISIPLSELWRRMDELPPEQGTMIVLYDDDPSRALRAASLLRREGYYRVHLSRGGLSAWVAAGGLTAVGEPPPPPRPRGLGSW